jgi:hypothetical protein
VSQDVNNFKTCWPRDPETGIVYDRGHLLGNQLGGPGDDRRNLVPLYSTANRQYMRNIENQIADYIQETGVAVFYTATPEYDGSNPVPDEVILNAWAILPTGGAMPLDVNTPQGEKFLLNYPVVNKQ